MIMMITKRRKEVCAVRPIIDVGNGDSLVISFLLRAPDHYDLDKDNDNDLILIVIMMTIMMKIMIRPR